jgi:signal transduction histidine kinase/ligand-binding sensor domain-containing protein/DNA-binding response OmpR family regulator
MKQFRAKIFIYLIILFWSDSQLLIYPQSLIFNHLTVEDGLSNNKVNTVIQDQTGFLWFGTEDGLNRYDGYKIKVFRNDPSDSNSLSDNSIWSMLEDRQGNIWIGTKSGILNKYDPVLDKFSHWEIHSDLTEENSINALYEDSKENIWIGTYKDGLFKLNPTTDKIDHWSADAKNLNSLSHNYIQAILEDNDSNIIIGTYIGLCKFNPDIPQNGFKRFYYNPNNKNSLSDNLIWGLSQSTIYKNIIWICTSNNLTKFNSKNLTFERIKIDNPLHLQYGTTTNSIVEEIINGELFLWAGSYSGLIRININSGITKRFVQDDLNAQSLSNNQINKIYKDRSGILWVATEHGISFSSPKSTLFNSLGLKNDYVLIASFLKNKNITAISKSSDNRVWIGTVNGLYLLSNLETNPSLRKLNEFDGYHIWSLSSTNENELWIGTFGKGLKQFNYKTNKITNWDLNDTRIRTQSVYYNKTLHADSKKNIWVGYWGIGVARINSITGNSSVWLNDPENPKSISHNDVWVIKEDRFGRIWLGTTGGGLNLFEDKDGGIFHHWINNGNDKNILSSNNIYSICEAKNLEKQSDSKIVLWLGTSAGLNKFTVINKVGKSNLYDIKVENTFYTVKDGLPDNSVNSILEDENGNLWLGTGSGITFFNVTNKTFTNFSSADGINGTSMNLESALQLNNGLMLFGSTKGLNIFNPKSIKLSSYKPPVVITDFQIFNQLIKVGKDSPLKQSITTTNEIVLPYNQDVFSFEFAALDYNSPGSIKYAYMMEGFDKEWINSDTRRFVTYTNLEPGTYTFKVKATNADGVWNDKASSIKVIIDSPWWRTPWAYFSYVLFIGFGLWLIRRFELNRTELRNELKLKEFEVKQKSELDELKSRFFANLSHEFRTPLMLIKGPVEQIKSGRSDKNFSANIHLIEKNSNRLKELIDQLLELSQLEKASIPLKAKKENLVAILKGLVSSFESLADQKNISLNIESNAETEVCWVDRDKFEKVITNLLSNAFKFTSAGDSVRVVVTDSSFDGEQFVEIKIADSGVGIPKDKIDKIFDRFFQVDDSTQRSHGGSGIGLALVKELVDLHKWSILVKSEINKGTEFTLKIPMWDDYLNEDEKVIVSSVESSKNSNIKNTEQENIVDQGIEYNKYQSINNSNKKPSILIVDDSEDVRKYLSSLLENDYILSDAENGEKGIIVATEIIPDLIISDVMMPTMDGMEFCKRIKSEWQTSDIPVILITAKASSESKIEGLEIGADDYLTKPFESKELFTRIKNLLEQRKRLRDKYSRNLDLSFETSKLSTADDDFINKALELINKNIDKVNYGTEQLAKELFVSRTQLHRKVMTIIGQPPGEFIRTIKLKHAAKLLLEKRFSVTQIAYEIGFSSPAQFSRAFSKQYNCTPSEYSASNKVAKN